MIKQIATAVLAALLCVACEEDYSVDPTLMPPVTCTGANTLGCLIDGWVYTGQRFKSSQKAYYYPATDEDTKPEVRVSVRVDTDTSLSFRIIDPQEPSILFYKSATDASDGRSVYTDAVLRSGSGAEEALGDGTAYITRFDLNARIISGTFSGGRIKEGRFDLRF